MPTAVLTSDPIDTNALLAAVRSSRNGGYVTFSGDVRDYDEGGAVARIDYVAYEELAEKQLSRIASEAEERWPGARCAVAHRIGVLDIGETSVYVAVGAPHRAEAFDACRWIIDRIKVEVPIWKREDMTAGDSVWIEGDRRLAANGTHSPRVQIEAQPALIDLLDNSNSAAAGEPDRFSVVDMQTSDVPEVLALEKRCFSLPWSASAYITEIGNPNAQYLVARGVDGRFIGYGGVWAIMDEMHITTLAVDPRVRGLRIGERMLIRLLQEGMKRGAVRATLEVRQHNHVAHNLYLKYGFCDVAIRKGYYSDNRENAIIMWAEDVVGDEYCKLLATNLRRIEAAHGGDPSR